MDYLVSQEGSLKLKEIAYLHSEAYAAPLLADTRMLGKVVGSRAGSFMVLS